MNACSNASAEETGAHGPRLSEMFNGHCRVLTIDADRSFEEVCAQYEQNLHLLLASEQPLEEQRFSPGASDALALPVSVSSPGGARIQTPQSAAGKSAALPLCSTPFLRSAAQSVAFERVGLFLLRIVYEITVLDEYYGSRADTPVKRLLDSSGGVEGLIAAAAAIPRLPLSPKGAPQKATAAMGAPMESPSKAKRVRSPMKPRSPNQKQHAGGTDENADAPAPARAIV